MPSHAGITYTTTGRDDRAARRRLFTDLRHSLRTHCASDTFLHARSRRAEHWAHLAGAPSSASTTHHYHTPHLPPRLCATGRRRDLKRREPGLAFETQTAERGRTNKNKDLPLYHNAGMEWNRDGHSLAPKTSRTTAA